MKRSKIREKLFQFLFQIELQKEDPKLQEVAHYEYLKEEFEEADLQYFQKLCQFYYAEAKEIDEIISGYLRAWTLDRLSKVDLALLRLAVLELKHKEETPASVIASEIVILTKRYSESSSKRYINGILGQLIQDKYQED